ECRRSPSPPTARGRRARPARSRRCRTPSVPPGPAASRSRGQVFLKRTTCERRSVGTGRLPTPAPQTERRPIAVATSTATRSFVTVPAGTIHVAQAGTGSPVLLLHQTPRSWDEYRDVVPFLGERFHAIAMDTIGFGDSSKPRGDDPDTIEMWAEVA